MKNRLKQQIFAFTLLVWTVAYSSNRQAHFVNYSNTRPMKRNLGHSGTGCMALYLKKELLRIWRL